MTISETRVGDVRATVAGEVVTATIDRPAVKNAINNGVVEGLEAVLDIAAEAAARILIIRGAGGSFCAGADLAELERMRDDPGQVDKFMARLGEVLDRIESAPFATVAVVEGYAVAGGCELLLACDVVLAATTARIGDRHLEYGLAPAAGGSVRLSRHLPKARARYLLLSGELLTADEAEQWGLVTFTVAADQLEVAAARVVARMAGRSRNGIAAIKRMIANADRLSQSQALHLERAVFIRHLESSDVGEGLSAFRERRKPVFN